MNTAGTCQTPARLSPSCTSPTENAPSPRKVSPTCGSPRRLKASAAPTTTGQRLPSIETSGKTPRAGAPKCMFPSRPKVGPSPRPRKLRNASVTVTPRAKWVASSRLSGATTSPSSSASPEPAATADCPRQSYIDPLIRPCRYSVHVRSSNVRCRSISRKSSRRMSVGKKLLDGGGERLRGREVCVFELGRERNGRVRRREHGRWSVEQLKALRGEERENVTGDAGRASGLLQHQRPRCLADRFQHCFTIERPQRAQVEHFDVVLEAERELDAGAVGDHGRGGTAAGDPRTPERRARLLGWLCAFQSPVERLVLEVH